MFFRQRYIPGLAIASYIVGDEKSRRAVVIDPTRDVEEYIGIAQREGLHITHILETHVHADYVSGSAELKARLEGRPQIHCSGEGGEEWVPPYADRVAKHGDELDIGSIRLRAIHTPGHTYEHITWALFDDGRSKEVPWLMFTGDFLFVGDVGRPDLLGEEARRRLAHELYQSVFERLPEFPDFTEMFPGHGAGSLCGKAIGSRSSSTLGYERRFNRSLQPAPEPQWTDTLLSGMPLAPPYFQRMKKVNAAGPKLIGHLLPGPRGFTAEQIHQRMCDHCLIVDVRPKEAFAACHIPGAINIPFGPNLPTWAGWVLPYDYPIGIVPDHPSQLPEVVTHLIRVGFDTIEGYLEDSMETWQSAGYEFAQMKTISAHDLSRQLRNGRPFILDVRTESEWNGGHIEGAVHIHGGLLQQEYDRVPRDRPVVVICGSGYRASIAASFLRRQGYEDVANVLGGMSAWKASGLPVV